MSSTNPVTGESPTFPAVQAAVDQALSQVGPHISGLLERAAPSPETIRALGEELLRADRDPRRVAHPELLDPETFWQRSAWPQGAAVVKSARSTLLALADELAVVIRGSEQVLDGWLVSALDADVVSPQGESAGARDDAIDAVVRGCESLHHLVARLRAIAPTGAHLAAARAVVDEARRAQAEQATHAQRDAESRSVDEAHRAAFEKAWSAGIDQEIRVRADELRSTLPYRHQDLLLTSHQMAAAAIAADVEAMVQELTKPILGIGERVVRRYDELTGRRPAPMTRDLPQ